LATAEIHYRQLLLHATQDAIRLTHDFSSANQA